MTTASSLRAELSSAAVNGLLIGAAGTTLAAGMLAVLVGPLGLLVLVLAPIDIAFAVMLNRRRTKARARAVDLASGDGRGVAIVRAARDTGGGSRGGQSPRHVGVEVLPVSGAPFTTDATVWWTDSAPGAWGVAAYDRRTPDDVLVYFADGPETPAEMEAALNRETGQYRREPVLGDEPPAR